MGNFQLCRISFKLFKDGAIAGINISTKLQPGIIHDGETGLNKWYLVFIFEYFGRLNSQNISFLNRGIISEGQ